jgi:putative spermidine/putrescine transport system substrate-binding protein
MGVVLLLAGGTAVAETMTVTGWGGASQEAERKAYYVPFAEESGIEVLEDNWNGELGKIRAMVESNVVTWDVVVADYEHAITGCDEGILEPVDTSALGDLNDFLPGTLHACGVPAYVFAVVSAYDEGHVPSAWGDKRPQTIGDVFDTQAFPGKRGLRKNPKWLLEQVLMADGVAPEQVYEVLSSPEGVERALARLQSIKDQVVWWETGAQPPQLLADGEVSIAQLYSSRLYSAQVDEGQKLVGIWHGQIYAANSLIVPKGAKRALAMQLLAYIAKPEVMARITNYLPYSPARLSAMAHVPAEMKPNLPTSPENMAYALSSGEVWWSAHFEEINDRFQNWLLQ